MSMETGFTVIRMGLSRFLILTILATIEPKIRRELGIDGGQDAYFGVPGGKL